MCLALIAIGQHPLYPIIVLSNRDEFYQRATAPAHFWEEAPDIYAGKDLAGGGTWLGVNTQGAFSLITNYRNPSLYDASLLSRGLIASNYLLSSSYNSPSAYVKQLAVDSSKYNLFNLIVGTRKSVVCFSNVDNKAMSLQQGVYGLSNGLFDIPWFKVVRAKELFNKVLEELIHLKEPDDLLNLLFPILEDQTPSPDALLPETGVSKDLEHGLSSIFVDIPDLNYGTRSSTIVLFEKNTIVFSEKTS